MTQFEHEYRTAVDKGIGLFMRGGYANVSIEDIIKSSGLNRYSIYSAYGGKLEFFIACVRQYCAVALESVKKLVDDRSITPAEAARRNLYAAAEMMWERKAGCLVCDSLVEIRTIDPKLEAECISYFDTKENMLERLFERARKEGSLAKNLEPKKAASIFLVFKFGLTNEIKRDRGIDDIKGSIDAFISSLIPEN